MTPQPISSILLPPPPIVLLVEDDADTRDMYHTALECSGFWVVDAPDAKRALTSALQVAPDVIITDLGLPGAHDGVALARDLKGDPRTAEIPVLAVTGRDPRSLGDETRLFRDVLLKPVLPDALVDRIQQTLADAHQLRDRSLRARSRVGELLENSERVLAKSQRLFAQRAGHVRGRLCPRCQSTLTWSERRKMFGVTFDYYQPCTNGCGLFCYNHSEQTVVSLTE